jgi:S-DNA-T family DNA segregation ATPase FtsK/SpoIIIE
MARVRRKTAVAGSRLNFEIAGIAALGLALVIGLAFVLPASRSGIAGGLTVAALHWLFGNGAPWFPFLIALIGAIVFLEINVPKLIATFGSAAVGFFLVADTALGTRGGVVGAGLDRGLRALVGDVGEVVVLVVIALSIAVWITNVSVKKVIGWLIARAAALRPPVRERAPRATEAPAGPKSLREAFHLPALLPRAKAPVAASTSLAVPAPSITVVEPPAKPAKNGKPVFDVETDDEVVNEDDTLDEFEEDELDAYVDDEDDDEYEDDEDAVEEDDDEALDEEENEPVVAGAPVRPAVQGEYEAAAPARHYRLPDLALFDPPQAQKTDDSNRAQVLEDTLASFGVGAKVTHIERGPSITRYELKPERGVKISRISALADDLALALAATSVRIEAPIPGKSAVGIEVPNATVSVVAIREILEAMPQRGVVPPLNMALGKDITGRAVFGDLGKMPHLLVAGATGSGKSVCLNCIIASLLVNATPDQVQMLFIDPKRVELTVYNGIPHLIKEVITDPKLAAGALFEMTKEMDQRYERFAKAGVRKIEEYNAKFPEEKLPYVVIVIDELADLMLIAPAKVETTICRLAQLARATGIHLIVATQRPSVDVITGIIKANIPSRIAFAVSSQVDSRTILDMGGAERLLGRGDMLYLPIDAPKPVRSQGALVTSAEISRLVEFWAAQARPENLLDVDVVPIEDDDEGKKRDVDPLCYDAAKFIIETNYASTAQLQSQFSIGHPRAVRIMKQLEDFKVVGPHEGTKPRKIQLGLGDLETISGRLGKSDQQELF